MKKLLIFLAIFSFLCKNTVNLISCENIANNKTNLTNNLVNVLKVNLETNINLEKMYLPHPVLIQKRGYKGALFNQYKTNAIKNLTDAF
ncbi:MAG: hypothetical protein OHM56_02605 [Spiroplasma phoeniceum]|nr:MAG: hypothetical protein OHM57_02045 [Spiroplasma phoeniceum]UZQ32862.1 MAG: hypothetical protein OHM56_02605 [Spiroplasma phoeniceum]